MSDDVGVTPYEAADGTPPRRLSHGAPGKGTLGTWRPDWESSFRTPIRVELAFSGRRARGRTSVGRGACVSALKPPWRREVLRRKGQGQNRTREIRPSGIVGGPG